MLTRARKLFVHFHQLLIRKHCFLFFIKYSCSGGLGLVRNEDFSVFVIVYSSVIEILLY